LADHYEALAVVFGAKPAHLADHRSLSRTCSNARGETLVHPPG
jgi:hypothetical protein